MKVSGNERKVVQKQIENIYKEKTKMRFRWQTGEKTRSIKIFAKFCDTVGIKDFADGINNFIAFVKAQTGAWLTWAKRDRSNYIGFIANEKAMQNFAIKTKSYAAQESSMTGVNDDDKWSDW